MPYIKQVERPNLENEIQSIVDKLLALDENDAKGTLNYTFYSILKRYVTARGLKYYRLNDLMGVMECCKLEFYRKVIAFYENSCIEKNGDV